MTETLFGDAPDADLASPRACFECEHFEGSKRDKTAFLFRIGKGYCEIDDRPGGRWNVVQDIVKPHLCKFFSPAPADLISSRQKLLKKYAQYR